MKPIGSAGPCVGVVHRIRRRRRRPNEHRSERSEQLDREPVRERNLKHNATSDKSEAPVKYELTGASCHLRTEARGVA